MLGWEHGLHFGGNFSIEFVPLMGDVVTCEPPNTKHFSISNFYLNLIGGLQVFPAFVTDTTQSR